MAVVATGFFDGVHLGHCRVLDRLVSLAREKGEEAVVVTFAQHPRAVLQQDARTLRLLTSRDEKLSLIRERGVDRVEVLQFTKEFAAMDSRRYVGGTLKKDLGAVAVVLGYDTRLGSDLAGPDEIAAMAPELGIEVVRCESVPGISSTAVRAALTDGRVIDAGRLLGRPYQLCGVVVSGKQLGRTIGFPTANMQQYDPLKILPARGAYITSVEVMDRQYYGMTNVGDIVETHIFDFDEDIYGLDIKVRFLDRIRDERKFPGVAELKDQLEKDRAWCLSSNYLLSL